jgi:hypothetical protein
MPSKLSADRGCAVYRRAVPSLPQSHGCVMLDVSVDGIHAHLAE